MRTSSSSKSFLKWDAPNSEIVGEGSEVPRPARDDSNETSRFYGQAI
jgi:hypothetical protein